MNLKTFFPIIAILLLTTISIVVVDELREWEYEWEYEDDKIVKIPEIEPNLTLPNLTSIIILRRENGKNLCKVGEVRCISSNLHKCYGDEWRREWRRIETCEYGCEENNCKEETAVILKKEEGEIELCLILSGAISVVASLIIITIGIKKEKEDEKI